MLALTLVLACGDKAPADSGSPDSGSPATDSGPSDSGSSDSGSSDGGSYAHFDGTSAVFSTNMYVAFPQNTPGTVEFRLRNMGLETQWAAVVHHDWPEGGAPYSRLLVEDDDTVLLQAYSEEHDVINADAEIVPY
ncbi:MAG: hypothetical protein GY913_16360 [Proteobacteria bacterium]|nr:hypothetical protein [Pseudomonadota bacterium]MCP4918478.1 hypothetical protein [Pseudomonadota bacterium]